jgi:hypothetical protein
MRRNNKKGSIKEAKECWKMQKAISEGSHKRIGKANQGKNDEKKKVMEHLACLLGGLFETFFPTSMREREQATTALIQQLLQAFVSKRVVCPMEHIYSSFAKKIIP